MSEPGDVGYGTRPEMLCGMPGKVVLVGVSFFVRTPKVRTEVVDNGPDGFGYRKEGP